MAIKLAAGGLAVVLLAVLLQGCLFGGGGDSSLGSIAKSNAVPTATPPATLPEPILLGQAPATGPGSTNPASSSPGTYTVKSGDTLGAIATANGVPPEQQAAWTQEVLRLNGIDDPRLLKAGQDLQLPRLPTAVPTRTTPTSGTPSASGTQRPSTTTTPSRTGTASSGSGATPTPTPRSSSSGGANTYTVQSGDTPLAIAIKLGVPSAQQTDWVNQLLTLNNASPSNLNIGQVLQLPSGTSSGGNSSSSSSSTSTPTATATKTN